MLIVDVVSVEVDNILLAEGGDGVWNGGHGDHDVAALKEAADLVVAALSGVVDVERTKARLVEFQRLERLVVHVTVNRSGADRGGSIGGGCDT